MKCINQFGLIIIIILFTGLKNSSQAQRLASEKPVESFYSKTTKEKLTARINERQPAAQKARQDLPSQKAMAQPSVPARIQPKKNVEKRKVSPASQKLPSEKPPASVLLPNVHAKKVVGPAFPAR